MIKVKLGESISKDQVIKDIESRFCDLKEVINFSDITFHYEVTGIKLGDLTTDHADRINELLLDDIVADGYLMGNIEYEFSGFDEKIKTVSIKVTVNDMGEYLGEYLDEILEEEH
jgi:hypothetical protein